MSLTDVGKLNLKDTNMKLLHVIRKGNKFDYT